MKSPGTHMPRLTNIGTISPTPIYTIIRVTYRFGSHVMDFNSSDLCALRTVLGRRRIAFDFSERFITNVIHWFITKDI